MGMTLLGQMLMEDGIRKGLEKGLEKGEMIKLISLAMKKARKGLSPDETAEVLEEDIRVITRIYDAVEECPNQDEYTIYERLSQQP